MNPSIVECISSPGQSESSQHSVYHIADGEFIPSLGWCEMSQHQVCPVTGTLWMRLAWFIPPPGQCEWSWHGLSHHQNSVNEAGMVYSITRTVWMKLAWFIPSPEQCEWSWHGLSHHQDSVNPTSLEFIIWPGWCDGVSLASTESTLLPGQCKLSQHRV